MISESVARALNHTAIVPRRNLEIRENRKPINKYLVKLKAQCQTNFGVRRDFSDAERTRWRWLRFVPSSKSQVRCRSSSRRGTWDRHLFRICYGVIPFFVTRKKLG